MHSSPVLRLALPLILSNITIPLLGVVDTMVMGHLPQAYYLGAVGIGSTIFNMLYWAFGFLRMGTTGLIAQAHGRDDKRAMIVSLIQACYMALFIAFCLLIFQKPIASLVFKLFDTNPEVSRYAAVYFHIRIWAAPATLINYVILGWFIGMQSTRLPLIIMLVTNTVGILADLLFVYGLDMTVSGVAWATVLAQYCSLLCGGYFLFLHSRWHGLRWKKDYFSQLSGIKALFHLNQHIFVRTLCLIAVFTFFTRESAKFGAVILAANMVLLNFQTLMAYALDSFANAAEALVGKAIGQDNALAFKQAVLSAGLWSLGIALSFCLIYIFAGKYLILVLTSIPAVVNAANKYLIWSILSPIIAVASYLFDGVFIGATRSREMRNTMLLAMICFFIGYFSLANFKNHGLWAALMIFLAARGLFMALCYSRGNRLQLKAK